MARQRGYFAKLQHQAKQEEKERERLAREATREYAAAVRRAEQAERAAERARAAAARAAEADRKRAEREAQAAHAAAKQAEVEVLNSELQDQYGELDGLLRATLEVDDYVDLESLRVVVEHPPFDREDLRNPIPEPEPVPLPTWPVRREVPAPKGIFGRKKQMQAAQAEVEAQYAIDYARWEEENRTYPARVDEQQRQYQAQEDARKAELESELARYERECAERESAAEKQNSELDELIAALGYGVAEAVQEYVEIVLANSVYPKFFPVEHSAEFDPQTAELSIRVEIPPPDAIPTVKAYRYVRTSDEITTSQLSQKAIRDRYTGVVNEVVLRTLHEVFEADRRGLVQSISLELGTHATNPATGAKEDVPFAAVAVTRETFEAIELAEVVPEATLKYLGAVVSRNPVALEAIDVSGVRGAK